MIKYNLKCENNHEFESWFSDSNEFEKLKKSKLLECLYCQTTKVSKSIMSPNVTSGRENLKIRKNRDFENFKKDLSNIRKYIEQNFEFVGDNLASKAREVYYDNRSKKNIYGIATKQEKEELKEEGIDLVSIPWVEKEN